jgi:porphyrinogen peroxidase
VHDLTAFEHLSVAEQERVFGRTKADSIELTAAGKPPTAHIERVETSVDGQELDVLRRSVPFGTTAEHGLDFVAFSAQRARYDHMLARRFGHAADGLHDRLLRFSRPTSGAYSFAPSLTTLNALGEG